MTDLFPAAVAHLLAVEGGYVDDPADAGGATKYGITTGTLSRWRGYSVSREMVQALTREEASQIYREWFWRPLGCDRLTQPTIATILLDAGALFGRGVSAVAAQKAARASGAPALAVDGHVGLATVTALNSADPRRFAETFSGVLRSRAEAICRSTPRDKRFLSGWERRVEGYLNIGA
jgi:lysozyme family protein